VSKLKEFFQHVCDFVVSVQTARAAEHLARCGRYAEVRALYLDKK
jgi:hypothetical protein